MRTLLGHPDDEGDDDWRTLCERMADLMPRIEVPAFTQIAGWQAEMAESSGALTQLTGLRERMAIHIEPLLASQASAASAVASVAGIGEHFAGLMPRVDFAGLMPRIARWQAEMAESTGALTQLAGLRERLADLAPRLQVDLPRVDLLLPEPLAEGIAVLYELHEAPADPARAKPAAADPLAEVLARMDDALTLISETLAFMNGAEDSERGQARHRLGQTAAAMAAFFTLYGLLSPNPDVVRVTAAVIGVISVWIMFIDYLARGE